MRRGQRMRLGAIGIAALALSACTMSDYGADYGGGYGYAPAPAPAYTAAEVVDAYAYIDRADSLWEAIGDAPPDHSFAFEGAEPWAWQTEAGYWIVVEDGRDGMRSYYFEPGETTPFLAVEPGRSFGFEGDRVAVVYGPDGGALPRAEGAAYLAEAMALFARARRIRATLTRGQWEPVDTQAWIDTSPLLFTSMIQIWDTGPQRYPEWRRHREKVRASDWRHRIEAERLRRRDLSEAFRRWRAGGFEGPPPGRWRRPGEARPDRPDRPGGPNRPGAGRPDRPDRPNRPGVGRPDRPDGPRQPGAGRPDRPRPDWNGPRRPDRPRPRPDKPVAREPVDHTQPGATVPVPPAAGERPRRPGGGLWRPRSRPGASDAAPATPRPRTDGRAWSRERPAGAGTSPPRMTPPAAQPRVTQPPRSAPPAAARPAPQPRPAPPRPPKLGLDPRTERLE